jgi:lipopolysaccharide heptosyltransferase I
MSQAPPTPSAGPVLPPPGKVLIIKPSALGDVVTALPVLRGLRRTFPQARLSWLLSRSCADLVAQDPDLDEVVYFDRGGLGRAWHSPAAARLLWQFLGSLRHGGYDWIIDLQGLLRSGIFSRATGAPVRAGFANAREGAWAFYTHRYLPTDPHTVDRNIGLARMLGIDARREDMLLHVPPAAAEFAEDVRRQLCGDWLPPRRVPVPTQFLVLAPPTRWPTKCYPLRHWRTVAGELSRRMPLAVLGTAEDRELCEQIAQPAGARAVNLAGRTTVPQMVGVIAASAAVVCSDSAAMHIAQAVGVEVVALIGPTRPERTGPILRGQVLAAPVPCRGCLRRRCRHITCMQSIDPAKVVDAVERALADKGR